MSIITIDRVIALSGFLAALWSLGPARCDALHDTIRDVDVELADDAKSLPLQKATMSKATQDLMALEVVSSKNAQATNDDQAIKWGEKVVANLFSALSRVEFKGLGDQKWLQALSDYGFNLNEPLPNLTEYTTEYYAKAAYYPAWSVLTTPKDAQVLLEDIQKALKAKGERQMSGTGQLVSAVNNIRSGASLDAWIASERTRLLELQAAAKAEIFQREKNTAKLELKRLSIQVPKYCPLIPKF